MAVSKGKAPEARKSVNIRDIQRQYAAGGLRQSDLRKQFGLSAEQVRDVLRAPHVVRE